MKISVSQKTCPRYASPESERAPTEQRGSSGVRRGDQVVEREAKGALQGGGAVDADVGVAPALGPRRLVMSDARRQRLGARLDSPTLGGLLRALRVPRARQSHGAMDLAGLPQMHRQLRPLCGPSLTHVALEPHLAARRWLDLEVRRERHREPPVRASDQRKPAPAARALEARPVRRAALAAHGAAQDRVHTHGAGVVLRADLDPFEEQVPLGERREVGSWRTAAQRGPRATSRRGSRPSHLASLADRHLLVEGVEVRPQNYSGTLALDAIVSGDVRSESGAAHWESFGASCNAPTGPLLEGSSRGASRSRWCRTWRSAARGVARPSTARLAVRAAEGCELPLRSTSRESSTARSRSSASRDTAEPEERAAEAAPRGRARAAPRLVAGHEAAWAEPWRRA